MEAAYKTDAMRLRIAWLEQALANARLHALQYQINPHFVFNTLNAGQQIAMMEGAEKTSEFLDKFASLFRYNLKNSGTAVTLKEEIENVRAYAYLLKARYGDWIQVSFFVDPNVPNIKMPSLVLQPLVENAFVHGIGSISDNNGEIRIHVINSRCHIKISIEDTGEGMSEDLIREALENPPDQVVYSDTERVPGIGLRNVIKRLRLFFGENDIAKIESYPGSGTKITLVLPT
jgi:two-component system, sensor histidine kinase YesM